MRIGDREVVHTASLIIPEGEEAYVSFDVGNWNVKLKIRFESSSEDKTEQSVKIEAVGDYGQIKFINWNNSLGTAIIKPFEVGRTNDNRILTFMACHWLIGTVHRLDLQFLLGAE